MNPTARERWLRARGCKRAVLSLAVAALIAHAPASSAASGVSQAGSSTPTANAKPAGPRFELLKRDGDKGNDSTYLGQSFFNAFEIADGDLELFTNARIGAGIAASVFTGTGAQGR